MANPPVDLLSSTLPTQSASENAFKTFIVALLIVRPMPIVPLIYLRILFTTDQCMTNALLWDYAGIGISYSQQKLDQAV
jgi:hypothetical protein